MNNRLGLIVGGIVLLGLGIWLGVALASSPSSPNARYYDKLATSLHDSQSDGKKFLKLYQACGTNVTCVQNAANNALNTEGIISNIVATTNFPIRTEVVVQSFSTLAEALERTYLGISETETGHGAAIKQLRAELNALPAAAAAVRKALADS